MGAEERDTHTRRSVLQTTGVASGALAAGINLPGVANATKSQDLVGRVNFVETSIDYSPSSNFPVLHWDVLPEYTVDSDENVLSLSNRVSPQQTQTFAEYEDVLADITINESVNYTSIQNTTILAGSVQQIHLSPNEYVEAATHPSLPARVMTSPTSSKSVIVELMNEETKVNPGKKVNIELSPRDIHHHKSGELQDKSKVLPELKVSNYGEVEVYRSE